MPQIEMRMWDPVKGIFLPMAVVGNNITRFTGRLDRMGKKIFEGDVVQDLLPNEFGSATQVQGVIIFCLDACAFEIDLGGPQKVAGVNNHCSITMQCIVIGHTFKKVESLPQQL